MRKMKYTIKHKVSKHRREKRSGVLNPVKPSKYFKYLAGELENGKNESESKGANNE
ncbi:hypothetical protein [Alkalibacillus almallahensis]|uniref:hypothetical protein n=1 Tax=Alkalibacillus almallahensis TaxID=1379154 RepID=UPI00141F9B75|nr:hypothetical protein [Alkalibacillus almallahensis]NIK12857.1 hypothetical protein [Alkalibacillus almallahensis]